MSSIESLAVLSRSLYLLSHSLSLSLSAHVSSLSPARSSNAPVPSNVSTIHPGETTPETRQIQMHPHTNGTNGATGATGANGTIRGCREVRLKPCFRLSHDCFRCEPLHRTLHRRGRGRCDIAPFALQPRPHHPIKPWPLHRITLYGRGQG